MSDWAEKRIIELLESINKKLETSNEIATIANVLLGIRLTDREARVVADELKKAGLV